MVIIEFCLLRTKNRIAGIITSELGHLLSRPVLDIKGLSIRKTTVPKKLRKEFTKILQEDVLEAPKINLKTIISKYDQLGDDIETSLRNGSTEYLLPKNLEVIESYKFPAQIEPVRATIIWNALEPEKQIVPPDKIDIIKLRADKMTNLIEYLGGQTVQVSNELVNFVNNYREKAVALAKVLAPTDKGVDISGFGFACVAIPKGEDKIPDYLIPFIDFTTMVNNNMTNGYIILESLGVYVDDVRTTKYKSNIIAI